MNSGRDKNFWRRQNLKSPWTPTGQPGRPSRAQTGPAATDQGRAGFAPEDELEVEPLWSVELLWPLELPCPLELLLEPLRPAVPELPLAGMFALPLCACRHFENSLSLKPFDWFEA
jgi:hypothetical protein